MNNLNSRIVKIVIGSMLIGVTLFTGGTPAGTTPVLSLIAIPFIVSGIMNWKPAEWCARKLVGFIKPIIEHARITSH